MPSRGVPEIESPDSTVIVALGSSLSGSYGSSEALLDAALAEFEAAGLVVVGRSRWWKSAAWPDPTAPEYRNGVAVVETALGPEQTLDALRAIEGRFGRKRSTKNAPRTLDLDLIAHGRETMDTPGLTLPHPRAHERYFVMAPLAEVMPKWTHPTSGKTAVELAEAATVGRDAAPSDWRPGSWEEHFDAWLGAAKLEWTLPVRLIERSARHAALPGGPLATPDGWKWVDGAFTDPKRGIFIARVFAAHSAPAHLAYQMLHWAVAQPDDRRAHWFVQPAVRVYGVGWVIEALTRYLKDGSLAEKAGAALAAGAIRARRWPRDSWPALFEFKDETVKQYVATNNPSVRRAIIQIFDPRWENYAPPVAGLVPTVIRLARASPDPYVRDRVEYQLGYNEPFRPLRPEAGKGPPVKAIRRGPDRTAALDDPGCWIWSLILMAGAFFLILQLFNAITHPRAFY